MSTETKGLGAAFAPALEEVESRESRVESSVAAANSNSVSNSNFPAPHPVPERRSFFARMGLALAGAGAFFAKLPSVFAAGGHGKSNAKKGGKHQWGMAIDLDRCSGCGACTVACRQENNVPVLGPAEDNRGAHIEWMSLLWRDSDEHDALPEALPFPCQHCERAPCTQVCPVGATYRDVDGITAQIWARCIGCRYCMAACPYSRRSFNWKPAEWDGDMVQMLNPDVGTRPRGVVEKCTFCHHRIQQVKETARVERRAIRDAELRSLTACAAACPAKAIVFGDTMDPTSLVSALAKKPRAFRLLEHLGTRPRVFYLKKDRRG